MRLLNLTPSGDELDPSNNGSADIFVNTASNGIKNINSLENNHIDTRPGLEEVENKSKEKWMKIRATEEL